MNTSQNVSVTNTKPVLPVTAAVHTKTTAALLKGFFGAVPEPRNPLKNKQTKKKPHRANDDHKSYEMLVLILLCTVSTEYTQNAHLLHSTVRASLSLDKNA